MNRASFRKLATELGRDPGMNDITRYVDGTCQVSEKFQDVVDAVQYLYCAGAAAAYCCMFSLPGAWCLVCTVFRRT